jgi:hypothetical protein
MDRVVDDERGAVGAWLDGSTAVGWPPPGFITRSPAQGEALARVREWTRQRFSLPAAATVMVAEIACGVPGCPPRETVVVFWTDEATRHRFKVFKPLEQVVEDDLPYAWLKDALIDDGSGWECC